MNALMKHEAMREPAMNSTDDGGLSMQVAKLQSDVQHIQSDVADIKIDLRALSQRTDTGLRETTEKIHAVQTDLAAKINAVQRSLDATRVWALLLYVAQSGTLLYVMARSLKWF